jgi:hypothetical protein
VVCVPLSYAGDVGYRYGLVLVGERHVLIGPLSVGVSVSSVLRSVVYRVFYALVTFDMPWRMYVHTL